MLNLSIENTRKVHGGGLYSYFYNSAYQNRIKQGDSTIKLMQIYVGDSQAVLTFQEKIRELRQSDERHYAQPGLIRAQTEYTEQSTEYYREALQISLDAQYQDL